MIKLKEEFFNFKRPSPHSTFSPSATDRWMACPFSIKASEGIPEETSVYAEAGTFAHQVCEDYANHYFFDGPITEAMTNASEENKRNAEGWVEVIKYYLEQVGDVLYFELEVGLPIYPHLGCFGTADALIVGTQGCALIDYKNGTGHNVGAGTPQLRTYMVSILNYAENIPEHYDFIAVVHQPNIDEAPKSMRYSRADIDEHAAEILYAIEDSQENKTGPVTGNHCFWCPAKRTHLKEKKCPAIVKKDFETAVSYFDDVSTAVEEASPTHDLVVQEADAVRRDKALIKLASLMPMLNRMVKDAMDEFTLRIKGGEVIEGLEVVEKLGNREWAMKDKELAEKIKLLYGIEPTVTPPPRIKTVVEVEKEVGKKKFDPTLVVRKSSKKVVVREDNVDDVLRELSNIAKPSL